MWRGELLDACLSEKFPIKIVVEEKQAARGRWSTESAQEEESWYVQREVGVKLASPSCGRPKHYLQELLRSVGKKVNERGKEKREEKKKHGY
ncbi:hypothetical protein H6P81_005866 [Aristolochia fimbriata]|uniref:Uncharacterized protein n=1 Tax=Aristolochia fimbriata TaxID=158543 RepID=A0AAV7EVU0_ARIFI|nr:hypothetical protein H6P81_005866 [Aristolochia fimbriata]